MDLRARRLLPLKLMRDAEPYLTAEGWAEPWKLANGRITWQPGSKAYWIYSGDNKLLAKVRVTYLPIVKRLARHYGCVSWR